MVFEPHAPPPNRREFLDWYEQQIQWKEGHRYDSPDVTTRSLRAWYMDMITEYPAMNGPYASDDVDSPKVTDYSVGKVIVYASFAWSEAEMAFKTMFMLADKHRVGFFDVSSADGGVWLPDPTGGYFCLHGKDAS